jgi:hypothetical protein
VARGAAVPKYGGMPDPCPKSRASALLNALSSPDRLALLSSVTRRQATGVDFGQLTRDGASNYRRAG